MKKRDIILMNAPFTDLSDKKIRPALVLEKIKEDLLICFIGSYSNRMTQHDIFVKADKKNQLRMDSIIKCNKIFTLHYSLAKKVLGAVDARIYKKVVQKINKIIN